MNFKKPMFWDYKKPNFLSYLLLPFTLFIRLNNFLLNFKKEIYNKKIKTICVGNIYVGGTGKTPTTIKIYNILKKLKISTVIGKKEYESQIDEVRVIKNYAKIIVDKSRIKILKKAKTNKYKVLIFDDGLQDKNICYDLQIVCFDSINTIGNGFLIPAGPLREKLKSLSKYDCVLIKDSNGDIKKITKAVKKINNKIKIFITNFRIKNLNEFKTSKKYLIFSGIGNPKTFKNILLKNRIKVVKEFNFPDHYSYKKSDIIKIKKIAAKMNLEIITTEKDYVKISKSDQKKIKYLKVELNFKKEKNFINYLKSKINEKN